MHYHFPRLNMSSSEEEIESLETCFDMGAMSSSIEPYQFEPDPRPGPSVACTQGSQAQDHSSSDDSDEGSDSEDQPSTDEWYSIALQYSPGWSVWCSEARR